MMRPVPVPIDERAARVARRRSGYRPSTPTVDASLWTGVLFWLGFAALAVVAGL